jgi:low density lipoprotein receptor-related protein 5/6
LLTPDADVPHPFGVTVYQNWIYWTDWTDSSLNRMDRWTGENREVLLSNLDSRPMDIHVYHGNRTRGGERE